MTAVCCPLTFIIFAIMRIILLYILLALLGQQTTVNGQQTPFLESENLKNSESEKGCEPRTMSHETFLETENLKTSESEKRLKTNDERQKVQSSKALALSSHLEVQNPSQIFNFSDSQILYFENQIRLADSLYKNYLPQYNFEEVKAAVMFFDSLRLTTDNSQRTTDFLETENLKNSESEKSCEPRAMSNEPFLESENLKTSESEKGRNANDERLMVQSSEALAQSSQLEAQSPSQIFNFSDSQILFLRAKAHYYHAVGLTERDDVVGACEHYFIALEIMELETENLKTSKSEKGRRVTRTQSHKDAKSQSDCLSDSATQILCDRETLRPCDLNNEDYEKIRFLSLVYTRLGELFLSEDYCNLAISKYRKALKYVLLLGENSFIANTYKCLGHSYQLYNMPDSALYYYNKSLETNHELPNRLDVEKCIARIMFYKGERDSAYSIIRNNLNIIDNYGPKDAYYTLLGEMYYEDKEYDSAVHYLVLSLSVTQYKHTIISSSKRLSSIYNILGDHEKVTYYDRITLSVLDKEQEKNGDVTKLHDVYRRYSDSRRKLEYDTEMAELRNINLNIFISVLIILTILLAINYVIRHKNDKKVMLHDETISAKETEIHKMKEEISVIKKENEILSNELESIKTDFPVITDKNIMEYYNCDICKRILAEIDRVELEQLKINSIPCLSAEDLALIELEANLHLNGYVKHILIKHPELKKQDIHCICLSLLNINEPTIAVLLGRSYNAVWTRMKKIRTTMNINSNADLLHI